MAPQQNSTLIDDSLDVCPSLLNLPEILQCYSPILPLNTQSAEDTNKNNLRHQELEPSPSEPKHRHQHKSKQHRSGSSRHGRRSRSISLYGVNSTVEQGNKEIPIWIGDETRYVSGVTNKTTCNDIIKAMIDDEYFEPGNNSASKDGAASRDYSDFVITESWRGIERSYDGNMAILPVWKAWSRVHNELRLTLKHHKDILDPSKPVKTKTGFSALRKYLSKLLKFAKNSKKDANQKISTEKTKEQCLISSKAEIPDEFLFVILPDKLYDKKKSEKEVNKSHKARNKNLKPSSEESAQQAEAKLLKEKLYRLSETRTSIRKQRTSLSKVAAAPSASSRNRRKDRKAQLKKQRRNSWTSAEGNNCIRKRKDAPIRNSIRNQLAQKTSEVDVLYEREYTLTKTLNNKCKLYKLQNELYTNPAKQLEISVGEIQHNIEAYAKEIIQTEHELLKLKMDIREDISIINNLKRLTLGDKNGEMECGVPIMAARNVQATMEATKAEAVDKEADPMKFVDNIYEFCDNNASMLV